MNEERKCKEAAFLEAQAVARKSNSSVLSSNDTSGSKSSSSPRRSSIKTTDLNSLWDNRSKESMRESEQNIFSVHFKGSKVLKPGDEGWVSHREEACRVGWVSAIKISIAQRA